MGERSQPKDVPGRDACLAMSRSCLSFNLRKAERVVTRHYDSHLAGAGVTAVQLPILAMIAAMEEATFRLLSQELDLDRSTLSRNLALLKRRGLLDIAPPSGPKPGAITLTRKGRQMLTRAHALWLEAHRAVESTLSKDGLRGGLEFLDDLRARMRKD